MDDLSRTAKWFTILVMTLVTAATVWASLHYGNTLMTLAVTYGPPATCRRCTSGAPWSPCALPPG